MEKLPERKLKGHWVQTERKTHEAWAALIGRAPKAAQLMHILTARVGDHNAVIASQKTLQELMGCSRPTIQRAIDLLVLDNWLEVRQIGDRGTVNAYVINDRVAWVGKLDTKRYSLFSASVIVNSEEQPDKAVLGRQEPLRRLPRLYPNEQQLPVGDGLDPPSQPFFNGMEPDIPATHNQNPSSLDEEDSL